MVSSAKSRSMIVLFASCVIHRPLTFKGVLSFITEDDSKKDQILLLKIDKYIGFCVHRRSYLLGSPVIDIYICIYRPISLMRTHNPKYARPEFHTQLAKMSFDKILDLTAGVYFNFYDVPGKITYIAPYGRTCTKSIDRTRYQGIIKDVVLVYTGTAGNLTHITAICHHWSSLHRSFRARSHAA